MPKQVFQRPTPVNHSKLPRIGRGTPGGYPDWGRKTGKALKTRKSGKKSK